VGFSLRLSGNGLLLLGLLLVANHAHADRDEFADDRLPPHFILQAEHLTLTIKGEFELEYHDIEGSGGPGHDSPTDTLTLGTRSPFLEMDSFHLALRLGFTENIHVNSLLEFTTQHAQLAAIWAQFTAKAPDWLEHRVEAGYGLPIVAMDRRTERHPLLSTSFWREPEMHLAWEGRLLPEGPVTIEVGASLAMMRPLTLQGVQDSGNHPGTINVLASGPARTFSGNGPVGGGRLRVSAFGFFLDGFGFVGELSNEGGVDVLRSAFSRYRNLPGYDPETGGSRAFRWAGGRVGYLRHGIRVWMEAVFSQEGLLHRRGWNAQASLAFRLGPETLFHTLEPLIRWERSALEQSAEILENGQALRSPALIDAVAWDWEIWTFAGILDVYREFVKLRVEYALIQEDNGVPALGIPSENFRNNELMVQLELRF